MSKNRIRCAFDDAPYVEPGGPSARGDAPNQLRERSRQAHKVIALAGDMRDDHNGDPAGTRQESDRETGRVPRAALLQVRQSCGGHGKACDTGM